MTDALNVLKTGVDSLSPWLQPDGELFDPVFLEPTQYGTAYYAYCNAVLAAQLGDSGADYLDRAWRGLNASLSYVLHPELPPRISSAVRETGETWGINHRDFFWPAILKTYLLFNRIAPAQAVHLESDLTAVRVEHSFAQRPPNNWSSVWLSGEWLRFRAGLSPYPQDQIDEWLGAFFQNHILLEQGFYMEPGLPNSYDLFTRYHLADMVLNGYNGRWKNEMKRLLETGLRRSLAVQLTDGSLASAYRSTGQTWTLGAQCAYFRMAAAYLKSSDPALSARAEQAAGRAFSAFRRYQRPNAPFSPVENLLPPTFRIGYELYTSDGHYSNMALAFLATAIQHGLSTTTPTDLALRAPGVYIEHDPVFRALAHNGAFSLHFNAAPAEHYDGFGIVDITFGPNRTLQMVSSVRATGSERFYNLGIALRERAGRSALHMLSQVQHDLTSPIETEPGTAGFRVNSRPRGSQSTYQLVAHIEQDRIHITESTPGLVGYKTLLIPYLRDGGTGLVTQVIFDLTSVRLVLGSENILISFNNPVEHFHDIAYGYENRRGLCGLFRVDFRDPVEMVQYSLSATR